MPSYVNGVSVPFQIKYIRERRFRWLPIWLPLCSRLVPTITLDAIPPAGASVVVVYDLKEKHDNNYR